MWTDRGKVRRDVCARMKTRVCVCTVTSTRNCDNAKVLFIVDSVIGGDEPEMRRIKTIAHTLLTNIVSRILNTTNNGTFVIDIPIDYPQ
jgi:hypothetical protein